MVDKLADSEDEGVARCAAAMRRTMATTSFSVQESATIRAENEIWASLTDEQRDILYAVSAQGKSSLSYTLLNEAIKEELSHS